jgi:FRG domain
MSAPVEWPEKRVDTWTELQEAIDPIAFQCVFRGQGDRTWPLLSSYNRLVPCDDEQLALDWERGAIMRFRSEAHLHLNPSVIPPNPFKLSALDTYLEWLMLMQHYGAPTRLLDWTQSPYVAIYFAVIDCRKNDAAIWYFNSLVVGQNVCKHFGKSVADIDYADFAADEIRRTEGEPVLFAAMKKFRSAREVAQQGVFTFTSRLTADHQSVIPRVCAGQEFGRIIIPQHLKEEFAMRLGLMNVTAAALFPGVEGVCSSIRDQLRLAVATRVAAAEATKPNEPPATC